jgi:hypothetical protein
MEHSAIGLPYLRSPRQPKCPAVLLQAGIASTAICDASALLMILVISLPQLLYPPGFADFNPIKGRLVAAMVLWYSTAAANAGQLCVEQRLSMHAEIMKTATFFCIYATTGQQCRYGNLCACGGFVISARSLTTRHTPCNVLRGGCAWYLQPPWTRL